MPSATPALPRQTPWGRHLFWLLVLGLSIGGLRNTLALEPRLDAQAREAACAVAPPAPALSVSAAPAAANARPGKPAPPPPPPPPCRLQPTRWERGPLGRTFDYEGGATRVRVDCRREYLVLGEYACQKTS